MLVCESSGRFVRDLCTAFGKFLGTLHDLGRTRRRGEEEEQDEKDQEESQQSAQVLGT